MITGQILKQGKRHSYKGYITQPLITGGLIESVAMWQDIVGL